jgi:hypothetical protein
MPIIFSDTAGMKSRTRKLDAEQVREIKKAIAAHGDNVRTHERLAKEYGVSRTAIRSIAVGHSWRSVSIERE